MKLRPPVRTLSPRAPFVARGLADASARLAGLVFNRLERLRAGRLCVAWQGRERCFGEPTSALCAAIEVRDPRFFAAVALRGSVGAGEAWIEGWWSSEDLPAVVRIFVRNLDVLSAVEGGLARVSRPFMSAWHRWRANDRPGARKNIAAHYDVSNEFFALFLDPTLSYSCALFADQQSSLREAQIAKLDALCQQLELCPSDHLLEIGTGWGALAMHAAREYGCRVTTTTISAEQHALARERIAAAGLEPRIELLMTDYRELTGRYDKLVSVEMIEAVGHRYYGAFFERCGRLLNEDGLMALQAITIADRHYPGALRSVDFIQRHVFPGACIPSLTALLTAATQASDLTLTALTDITPHYARTLAIWRANLLERRAEVAALGLDERFLRLWEFYFAYCEGGFRERHIGDVQLLFRKPRAGIA